MKLWRKWLSAMLLGGAVLAAAPRGEAYTAPVFPGIGAAQDKAGVELADHPGGSWSAAGAQVMVVRPGSPFARAGIEPGDVITSINRYAIYNADNGYLAIINAPSGVPVPVTLITALDRKVRTFWVTF